MKKKISVSLGKLSKIRIFDSHRVLVYVKIGSHYADVNVTYSDLYIIQNTNRITDAQIFLLKSPHMESLPYITPNKFHVYKTMTISVVSSNNSFKKQHAD